MARKRFTAEQIIIKLREAEVELAKGQPPAEVCRKLGVTEQTYYRWRKEYGGLRVNQAKRLKGLETENARLKKLVADQALDIAILKEASSGNHIRRALEVSERRACRVLGQWRSTHRRMASTRLAASPARLQL
jgi:putative transposase